ncbi:MULTISPECIES: hypothetical protein [unclassified Nocardioides]|uniref:hypothetical protein n=1 Tax=unclassified Nocardioides TaxID=2615069 RepID=UPI0026663BA4|nr:hypothetical protein [Nocardioides sp. Arc9.136]WKN49939.1 hypothetical protein OSR43_07400 [Nocardioides sp. Arc9.136]
MESDAREQESAAGEETPAGQALEERTGTDREEPDWWHRDHPVFTPLSGFFAGLLAVTLLPGIYAAVLGALFDSDTAERLFPFVVVVLAVPLVLLAVPRARRFARYMLLGAVLTALVVGGVAALVLWYLMRVES